MCPKLNIFYAYAILKLENFFNIKLMSFFNNGKFQLFFSLNMTFSSYSLFLLLKILLDLYWIHF